MTFHPHIFAEIKRYIQTKAKNRALGLAILGQLSQYRVASSDFIDYAVDDGITGSTIAAGETILKRLKKVLDCPPVSPYVPVAKIAAPPPREIRRDGKML